ncbi:hypothetical protein KRR38_25645 [Novosphingobium sp. G106]|uniref:hypothetical protein n=1 Tax=Novosphingobium sp. G106 TaxID=2849500 RepID=UPI001C2D07B7|nr:hypothetical protein [Novosphingobium sp. G106]MBV1690969.1 hypothetical protein [Novosphingobium sp. G106]
MKSILGEGCNGNHPPQLRSWCSWTTFGALSIDARYWVDELPLESELGEQYVHDGGTWGQPFLYEELAHVIIPRRFIEDSMFNKKFTSWEHEQDIDGLSVLLNDAGIEHRTSQLVLEVKLF